MTAHIAARLFVLGLGLAVLLTASPAVDGIASSNEQLIRPETEAKTGDAHRHGTGYDICTDHANRTLTGIDDETDFKIRPRDTFDFPDRTSASDTPRTWTFLFYDDADFYNAYDPFYHFAQDAHSDPNVNVVVLRDRNNGPASVWHVDQMHGTRFLEPWGEVSMARHTTLRDFIEWGKEHYPADRYFLAMYDHGGGWRGACEDITDGGSLSMRSIARGIAEAGGVDILAFTAPCMMGAMESVYEVRECVDVYIGSEELSGYLYWLGSMGPICDVLNRSESLTNEDIGRRVIDIVESNPRWLENPSRNWATMSAMSTSGITLAVEQLGVVADYMGLHAARLIDKLERSREKTWLLGSGADYNTKTVDIYDYTLQLSKRVSDPFLLEALQDLRDLLDDTTVAEIHRQQSTTFYPHGLSLYFPASLGHGYAPVYGRVLDLTRDTSWDDFLRAFYKYQRAPRGSVAGFVLASCPTPGTPLGGVTVTACQTSTGDLLGACVTGVDGSFEITGLVAEDYVVEAFPPLGYAMADGGVDVSLSGGTVGGVDLALVCTGESNNPRGTAYWKRAVGEAMDGGGQALLDASEICSCLDAIDTHFTSRGIMVYASPTGASCSDKLVAAVDILRPLPPVKTDGSARSHLMALMLNVAAGNIRTDDVISKDGATVSQAITYCNELLGKRAVDALVIANLINNGVIVPEGWIPLGTPQIAFTPPERSKTGDVTVLKSGVADTAIDQSLSVSVSPNPFNPSTTISFNVPSASHVTVVVYDITGRRVATLVDQSMSVGSQRAVWNGKDAHGNPVGSGVYFYRVTAGSEVAVGKMLLLK